MDKNKKTLAIIITTLMIINIWTTLSLKKHVKNLQNEVGRMHSNFSHEIRNSNMYIDDLRHELLNKMEKGESLLSSFETEVDYKNGKFEITVKVVPKEKGIDEIIFLSLDGEKKQATSDDGSDYIATFEIPMSPKLTPTVLFEAPTGIRQEVLPEIYLDELFSLGYDSGWGIDNSENISSNKNKAMFTFTVYPHDERSVSLLKGAPRATILIKDNITDTEVGCEEMKLLEKSSYDKELKAISFEADLSRYLKKEGSYTVWVDMKTEDGISYRTEIASFDYNGNHSGTAGGSSGTLYPNW